MRGHHHLRRHLCHRIDRPLELVEVAARKRKTERPRRGGRHNADVEPLAPFGSLGGVAGEVAAVRNADRARLSQAVEAVSSATP